VQAQTKTTWPATTVVARAYLDQLTRRKAIQPERAASVKTALDRADKQGDKGADQLTTLATQLESDAASANGRDAVTMRSLAETLKGRAARLRAN
jgi:hypothetical protein